MQDPNEPTQEELRERVDRAIEALGPDEVLHFPHNETKLPYEAYMDRHIIGFVYPDTETLKAHTRTILERDNLSPQVRASHEAALDLEDGYRITMTSSVADESVRPTVEQYEDFLRKLKLRGIEPQPIVQLS